MNELLKLLKDGRSRTVEMLAEELHTSAADVRRELEFLERIGTIRKVAFPSGKDCGSCMGCGDGKGCKGCMPENAKVIWERSGKLKWISGTVLKGDSTVTLSQL